MVVALEVALYLLSVVSPVAVAARLFVVAAVALLSQAPHQALMTFMDCGVECGVWNRCGLYDLCENTKMRWSGWHGVPYNRRYDTIL